MRIADGVEEVFEAGDAFFIGPGHTPIIFAGCEVVYFTRTEEGNRELAVVVPKPHEVHARARDGSAGRAPAITTVGRGLGITRARLEVAELHPSDQLFLGTSNL